MADKDPFEMTDDELSDLDPDSEVLDGDDAGEFSGDDHETEAAGSGPRADDEASALRREVEALRREQEAARIAERQAQAEGERRRRESELETLERELTAKRRKALEEDDMDAFDRTDAELTDVRLERRAAPVGAQPDRQGEQAAAPEGVVEQARAWTELNPEFFTDEAFKAKALEINAALLKEGYRVDDPKLYRELSARLAGGGEKTRPRAGRVAGVSRGNAVSGQRPASQRKLDASDLRAMRKYNMDPQNPKHRRAWANRNAPL